VLLRQCFGELRPFMLAAIRLGKINAASAVTLGVIVVQIPRGLRGLKLFA